MDNPSDFLINKFAWTTTLNLLLLILFLPRIKLDEWFKDYCRRNDGSIFGLFAILYGLACMCGWISFCRLFDFKSYDPAGTIKATVPFGIITSIIPIMIGRELRYGKKILTR
jgi:hypothetical protein